MSMHQYIGARYVPYYYENSLDPTSTEWEPNVSYEPLTVVTLPNLHCYISKKFVPDTIGTPAANAEYWLDRGYDNAYIQDLQDQIDQEILDRGDADTAIHAVLDEVAKLDYSFFNNKKVYILGDSLSDITVNPPNWTVKFTDRLTMLSSVTNNSMGGRSIGDGAVSLAGQSGLDADYLIIFLGTNDFGNNIPIGASYADTSGTTCASLNSLASAISTAFTTTPEVFFVTPPKRSDKNINTLGLVLEAYEQCIQRFCIKHNWHIINLVGAPNALPASITTDGLHIATTYAETLADYIIRNMISGGTGVIDQMGQGGNLSTLLASGFTGTLGYTFEGNVLKISGRITGTFPASGAQVTSGLFAAVQNVTGNVGYMWQGSIFVGGTGVYGASLRFINDELYIFGEEAASRTGECYFTMDLLPGYCNDTMFASI